MTYDDLPLLTRWLAEPHVREWWRGEPRDLAAVTEKYGPYLDGRERTELFVVMEGERPVGMMQRYAIADHADWAATLRPVTDTTAAAGIDYLIGEPDAVGRGLGTAAIAAFAHGTLTRYDARAVVVAVQQGNRASWRALERAGFIRAWTGELDTDDPSDAGPSYVYVLTKPATTAPPR
jgi:aminoglycoside 6'-N-acetyltransferase